MTISWGGGVLGVGESEHDGILIERSRQLEDLTWSPWSLLTYVPGVSGEYSDPMISGAEVPAADTVKYRAYGYKDVLEPYSSVVKRYLSPLPSVSFASTAVSDACAPGVGDTAHREYFGSGIWGCP